MFKKIGISILIAFILALPVQQFYMQNAHAFVISKVASQAAKQVAKVPIRDITKDIAFEMAQQAIAQNFDPGSKYTFEENYAGYCVSEVKADGSCTDLMQIKKDLTTEDLQKIDKQVDVELDKAITGGKGLTRWQKILDWFIPVWVTAAGATAATMALDPESRGLFKEVGYNTLVSLGLIKPVQDKTQVTELDEVPFDDEPSTAEDINPGYYSDWLKRTSSGNTYSQAVWDIPATVDMNETVTTISYLNGTVPTMIQVRQFGNSYFPRISNNGTLSIGIENFAKTSEGMSLDVKLNDEIIAENMQKTGSSSYFWNFDIKEPRYVAALENIKKLRVRMPYEMNGKYYTDFVVYSGTGDVVKYQLETLNNATARTSDQMHHTTNHNYGRAESLIMVSPSTSPYKYLIPPTYEVAEAIVPDVPTQYEDEDSNMAFVPPGALPYTETETGESLVMTPNEIPGEEPVFTKPDGTVVPGDNVTVGEPELSQTPEGVPQVTPSPTPSNPTPEPIPLVPEPSPQPDPENPPPGTTPPGTDEPPLEPFPEGETCQEGLKFPIFSPLKETFSTSFPFSIPWDIGRAIEAAFGDIGTEKPEYELGFDVAGEKQSWKITVPAFFDDWKPFTDSLLVFTFDILIMFGIYRFVKGAGS